MDTTGTTSAHQTRDVDEQAMLLRGWNQTYHQLSAGTFSGSLVETDLGGVHIMCEFTSRALQQTGMLPEDRIALGLLLSSPSPPLFCGRLCDEGTAIIFSGCEAFEFHSPGNLRILDFVIDRDALRERLGDEESHALSIRGCKPHLRNLPPGTRQTLQQLARDVFDRTRHAQDPGSILHDLQGTPHDRNASSDPFPDDAGATRPRLMREELLDALIDTLQGSDTPDIKASGTQQIRIVEEARALMRSRPADGNPSIHDICQQLRVARRSLQHAFQKVLGTSPHQYQRALRLNGARQAIKQHQRVADAATEWGFWHFGRFSREYRLMFGELPSETGRRVRCA